MAANNYPVVLNGAPVDADAWFNAVGQDLTAASALLAVMTGQPGLYVPVWASDGTPPVLGNGVIVGKFWQAGHLVWVQIALSMGSTTTFGTGRYGFTLPVAAPTDVDQPIAGSVLDNSAGGSYSITGRVNGTSIGRSSTPSGTNLGASSPMVFAVSDQINYAGLYISA
jgi:hypothetical protein